MPAAEAGEAPCDPGHPCPPRDRAAAIAWLDGAYLPQDGFSIPPGDAGFVLGAMVTEQLRTFGGSLFLPERHRQRFESSLAAAGIDTPVPVAEIVAAAATLARHNHSLLPAGGDLGVVILATPGDLPAQHAGRASRPRVAAHSFPLAFALWAAAYRQGVSLRTVPVTQVPGTCWPIHLKCRSRMHYHLADRAAAAAEPGARAILCHTDGRVSETSTANVALVRDGTILTPPPTDALPGISLAHLHLLCRRLGIPWHERSLGIADLHAADEVLLTSTPSCLLPAARLDGRPIGAGIPGPMFSRLIAAWTADVGLDIIAQAERGAAAPVPHPPA